MSRKQIHFKTTTERLKTGALTENKSKSALKFSMWETVRKWKLRKS